MANSIGDFIRSIFPSMVNRNGKTFKALLADEQGGGTIEKIFAELEETRKSWTDIHSIYETTGEMFEKTMDVFSVLTKLSADTEEAYLNRLKLLFYRNGHTLWGTAYDILDIFKTLFKNENVYLVNNTDTSNLLVNSTFEKENSGWQLNNCSYEREARFEGTYGVSLNTNGTVSQSVILKSESTYFLHFFLKGAIKLKITDNNGRFWNPGGGDIGTWASIEHNMSFTSTDWDNISVFFATDKTVTAVTIEFSYSTGEHSFIDYARLNEKTGASTFSLIAVFEGVVNENNKTAHFAPGTSDEEFAGNIDYSKASYFDNTFIFGSAGMTAEKVYQELLDILQPGGVTGFVEVLTKESDDIK